MTTCAVTVRPSAPPVPATLPVLAAGRDCTIHRLGADRVLRTPADGACMRGEAATMRHVRAEGYPVPRVHDVGPAGLELDLVDGPTMLADLLRRPWCLTQHARTLADLHRRLGTIEAPADLRPGPVPGDVVVHLDLHPGNVMLGPEGPVVIDWAHAARGAGASDIALTWTSLACFDHDATGLIGRLATRFRAVFLDCFLRSAGRENAQALLAAMVDYRLGHPRRAPNGRPHEREALLRLAGARPAPHRSSAQMRSSQAA